MRKTFIYRVFAITAGKKAFIGKTTSDEMQPILRRHIRGEYITTKDHFTRDSGSKPRIHVLEEIQADSRIAYRHTIAFIRMFSEAGYQMLNSPGMLEDADDIHELTKNIYNAIKTVPVTQWLQPKITPNPQEPQPETEAPVPSSHFHPEPVTEQASERITLRVTPSEKKRFTDLAKETGVTQHQMLMLLMANQQYDNWYTKDWSSEEYVRPLLNAYKDEITKLEEENKIQREELKESRKAVSGELKAKEQAMRNGICEFINHFTFTLADSKPLSKGSYRQYLAETPHDQRHRYPDSEDFFLFYPEAILMGRGRYPARFIVGQDSQRNRILMRYYPKPHYVGFPIGNSKYGVQGSCWFVRCEQAKDGAMDVIFSLPMDIMPKGFTPEKKSPSPSETSLNALLHDAKRRSEGEYEDN